MLRSESIINILDEVENSLEYFFEVYLIKLLGLPPLPPKEEG